MKQFLRILFKIIIFGFLTFISQIGGITFLFSLYLNKKWKSNIKVKPIITFLATYLIFTLIIVPIIAPIFGREKIKNTDKIKPTNFMTVLLNRNYVKPKLNILLKKTEKELQNTEIEIHYLDANFPFIDDFPLLPHLSHNDGKK